MKLPVIINIDSKYDWTNEVRSNWDTINSKNLHQKFPTISEADFDFRLKHKLVIIGLCSPSFIDRFYSRQDNCHDSERDNNSWISREEENWRASQLCKERNVRLFDGEEPHFRHPKICSNYIVEPYGIYTDDCSKILSGVVDMDKLPLGAKGGAGIFLCPERIVKIYPSLLEVLHNPKHPLPLADNPVLTNLKMLLLHELGHHIFPVHRNCKGRKYISEGLANYFCYSNLTETERAWLLYKSRTLQPPEYSSYRFVSILHHYFNNKIAIDQSKIDEILDQYDKKITLSEYPTMHEAFKQSFINLVNDLKKHLETSTIFTMDDIFLNMFKGNTDGWDSIFKTVIDNHGNERTWNDIIEGQTEHLRMALTLDFLPAVGFLDDLDELFGNKKKWRLNIDHGMFNMHHRHYKKKTKPDFIWDLYNEKSILPWVLTNEIPDEIWNSWGMSTSHANMGADSKLPGKLSWPAGPLIRTTTRQDWERIVNESPYQWARDAAMVWLLDDFKNKSDVDVFLVGYSLSDKPSTNCAAVIDAFYKYSGDFNSSVKNKIISILLGFIEGMKENRSIRIDAEKLIDKLRKN